MTRLWTAGQEIRVQRDAHGKLLKFTWQGRTHPIQKVRQRWQVDADWWSEEGRVFREYFAVTTTDGLLCVLYFDFLDEQWYIAKCYD
ncbi:MAG: hypothetical protein HY782_21800 [Chloroflexi bacterium]|nr:hypothetical protein [Chloroflexota bacterium]